MIEAYHSTGHSSLEPPPLTLTFEGSSADVNNTQYVEMAGMLLCDGQEHW